MNSRDKLTTAREIAMLYVIFWGSDYDKRKGAWISDKGMHAGEKGANKHSGLLEEVIEGREINILNLLQNYKMLKQAEQRIENTKQQHL